MAFALEHGVEYIGLSFVQRAEDVAEAREIAAGRAWIMTKLEKPQAPGEPRRHPAPVRRGDGRARRPGRRAAARGSAARPEAHRPRSTAARQAGGGGDPDAGEHDLVALADPGGGVGRRDRGVRRGGRGDALGRDGGRPVPVRGGQHHGPHRRPCGAGRGVAGHHRREPAVAGTDGERGDRGGGAPDRRHHRRGGDLRVQRQRREPRCGWRASDARRRSWAFTPREETARRLAVVWGRARGDDRLHAHHDGDGRAGSAAVPDGRLRGASGRTSW